MNSFVVGIVSEAVHVPGLVNKLILDEFLTLALSIVAADLKPLRETSVVKLNAAR